MIGPMSGPEISSRSWSHSTCGRVLTSPSTPIFSSRPVMKSVASCSAFFMPSSETGMSSRSLGTDGVIGRSSRGRRSRRPPRSRRGRSRRGGRSISSFSGTKSGGAALTRRGVSSSSVMDSFCGFSAGLSFLGAGRSRFSERSARFFSGFSCAGRAASAGRSFFSGFAGSGARSGAS